MIKVIVWREDKWMDWRSDYRYWNNLCRSYDATLQLLEKEWSEAEIPDGHTVIVFDEVGEHSLSGLVHPENAVYVFGKTGMNDMPDYIPHDLSVRVDAPHSKSTFAISVCGAVLYDRYLK